MAAHIAMSLIIPLEAVDLAVAAKLYSLCSLPGLASSYGSDFSMLSHPVGHSYLFSALCLPGLFRTLPSRLFPAQVAGR